MIIEELLDGRAFGCAPAAGHVQPVSAQAGEACRGRGGAAPLLTGVGTAWVHGGMKTVVGSGPRTASAPPCGSIEEPKRAAKRELPTQCACLLNCTR